MARLGESSSGVSGFGWVWSGSPGLACSVKLAKGIFRLGSE